MTIRLWKGARVSFIFGFSVTYAGEEHFKRTSRCGSQEFQYMVKGSVFLGLGEADAMADGHVGAGRLGRSRSVSLFQRTSFHPSRYQLS